MAKSKEIEQLSLEYYDTALQENKDLVDEYLDGSVELSDQTLKQYKSALRIYLCYINRFCNNRHLTEMTPLDFKKYLNWLYKCGLYESAIKLKRSPISMLNEYLITYYQAEYPTFHNYVTKGIKTPSTGKRFEKEPLTTEEVLKLFAYLEEKEDWQLLAYFKFTYCTGCRKNESRQLLKEVVNYAPIERTTKLRDEDGKEYVANVKKYKTNLIKTKGSKSKAKTKLTFDDDVLFYLKRWLEVRGEDDCPYMFVSGKTNPHQVSDDTFGYWCKTLEKVIGRRFHPHLLRSSRATNLALEGKNLEAIQKLLGHQSSDTTKIYICKDDDEDEDEIFVS